MKDQYINIEELTNMEIYNLLWSSATLVHLVHMLVVVVVEKYVFYVQNISHVAATASTPKLFTTSDKT